jgi:hypothetical protein
LLADLPTIQTSDKITSAGSAKGGLISKEDVVLALKKGTAVAGSAARHSAPVVAAVSHSPAATLAAHGTAFPKLYLPDSSNWNTFSQITLHVLTNFF